MIMMINRKGIVMLVAIKEIAVGARFRKKFDDMDELAKSIDKYGLIEPIVLDENNNLIAGERRLRAHIQLKRLEIEVRYMNDLSDLQKKEIELEENIQRKEFTWMEEVEAKAQLHLLKQQIYGAAVKHKKVDGSWGISQTADTLGKSATVVSQDIQLAKGLKAFPELLKEKSKTIAFKKLKMLQEKILANELQKRISGLKEITHPSVVNGNCLEELKKIEDESIDLVLTDPPYGIDIGDSHTFGRMGPTSTYVDSEFETYDLLDKVIKELFRVLKDDRHMYMFFAIDKYSQIVSLLLKHGFSVYPIPIIWDKGSGSYPSQSTTFVHSYEPFLHIMKGARKLNGTPKDVLSIKRVPSDKKTHPSQKPTELLRDLIELSTMPAELVLDPFAGSGSTLLAALETSRRSMGIELNSIYYKNICEMLTEREST